MKKLLFFLTVENQTQLATITEKERSANEKVMDLSTQVATLESQNSRLRQDKAQLQSTVLRFQGSHLG